MIFKTLLLLFFIVAACTPKTKNEKISETTYELIQIIKKGDYKKFRSKIAVKHIRAIGKDEDMIEYDFQQMRLADSLTNLSAIDFKFSIPDTVNSLGQVIVTIPYIYKDDEYPGYKFLDVQFFFGPNELFPFSKISNYETIGRK
jgi:hypothetical protein